jgi:alpha-tubulin suppressor-like RCC1 family protein
VQVTALGNTVAEVATGDHHSCARKDDGTLWCWGTNDDGELGDGTKTAHPTPVQVTALGNAVAGVAAGFAHTCAIKNDGTLWCWGRNDRGQLGNGTTIGSASPVKVTALGTTVLAVSAGITHTCARRTNGYAYCWGANENGELGSDAPNDSSTPLQVTAVVLGSIVEEIAAGADYTCARNANGAVYCFGANTYGQLGDGTANPATMPTKVLLGVCP